MPNKKYIGIVKKRLWASGFNVTERSLEGDGFDLLVEGSTKVRVTQYRSAGAMGKKAFSDEEVKFATDGGVYAIVMTGTFGAPIVAYAVKEKASPVSAREAFGLPISKSKKHGNKAKSGSKT